MKTTDVLQLLLKVLCWAASPSVTSSHLTLTSYFGLFEHKASNSSLSSSCLYMFTYQPENMVKLKNVSQMCSLWATPYHLSSGIIIPPLNYFRRPLKLVFLPLLSLFNLSYAELTGCLLKQVPAPLRPVRISSHHLCFQLPLTNSPSPSTPILQWDWNALSALLSLHSCYSFTSDLDKFNSNVLTLISKWDESSPMLI